MRFSLIVLFALADIVGRVHGWCLFNCSKTTTPVSIDGPTADNSAASTADPTATGVEPVPGSDTVTTTKKGDWMGVALDSSTTSATSSSTTTETEPPTTSAESTTASTTVPIETTTSIPSTGTTQGGVPQIPLNPTPPTTQSPAELHIPSNNETETSTSASSSSSSTSTSTTTPEDPSTTPKAAAIQTTVPAPRPPPNNWTPLPPPKVPLSVEPEKPEVPEVTDPTNRVVSRAPKTPDVDEKKEEGGGTNLTGLWVALGIALVLAIIGGVVAGIFVRRRMQKKKKAGESKKTDPELGMSALDPVGGGGAGIAASLPPVPVAPKRPRSRGRKPTAEEKRWAPVKQMEAGRIVKDKFAFEGRLNFDATGNHGPLVHATADQKSHSLRDVMFADEMNKVYDMGSEIERVVLSEEHDNKPKDEEKADKKPKETDKEKPKTEKSGGAAAAPSAPPGDPKSQTKPPPPT